MDVTAVKGSEVAADAEAEIGIAGAAGNAIVIAAYKQLIWNNSNFPIIISLCNICQLNDNISVELFLYLVHVLMKQL